MPSKKNVCRGKGNSRGAPLVRLYDPTMRAPPPEPTKEERVEKLQALIAGEIERRDASVWAMKWVAAGSPGVEDNKVWQALVAVGGYEAITTDRPSSTSRKTLRTGYDRSAATSVVGIF